MTRPTLPDVDLSDIEIARHGFPHELFTRIRKEAPIFWHPLAGDQRMPDDEGFWVLSRYADVQATNRDVETFCSIDGPSLANTPMLKGSMLVSMDGSAHNRQRRLISAGFTPRMVSRIEDQARQWAVKIIESALEKGEVNFVQEVAYQLPMHMIADIMGIPVEDRDWLFNLANDFMSSGDPELGRGPEKHMALQVEMFQYAQKLGEEKRKNPQDDIWTLLSTVEVETEEGESTRMGESELDFFFMLLTLAGSETTRNAISGGLMVLLEHPDQLATLRNDPSAMRPAAEEIIRWTSPVAYFARRATCDTEIAGVPIKKGERLSLWYPSANRDEAVFEDPFRFDIMRTPNHHIAFGGGGPHFCLGANLARREIAILFEELLARVKEIEITGPPVYGLLGIFNPILMAPKELPVRLA